ncbi:hypothetical protein B0T13DRAFT_526705 [Neurospora crassa]|nr:hypothetical protein B0T13DRAFT_526705 [Neurospora crassa]
MSTPSPNSILKDEYPKTITVKELHPTFGAEVLGIQWGDNGVISDEQLQDLRDTYGFIVLRATPLTDSTHVSFSRLFASGPLDDISRFLPPGRVPRYYPHLELFDASNLSDDGRAILDPSSSPRAMLLRANSSWHSDLAYNPRRSSYSLLRAVELPSREPGEMGEIEGNTEFADSRTAWEELAAEKKRELLTKDWTGVYNAAHSRKLGRLSTLKTMWLTRGLWRALRWEQPGDLVIWDNRATTAFDQGPTAWGLNGEGAPLPTLKSITKEKGLPLTQSAAVER